MKTLVGIIVFLVAALVGLTIYTGVLTREPAQAAAAQPGAAGGRGGGFGGGGRGG
ncbi:MAG: hypothetical protein HW394_360, partial [Acidobacteria bacterium]|nr:hypothetical protein [Acidobacteriota bacterium]